ncbi:MAG: DoxX family protein [Gemmatimonadota bacterium]
MRGSHAHGAQKLFVLGLPGLIEGFGVMGIPLADVAAPAVALLEFFGGIALFAGLFTPVVAAGLALVMLGALVLVHLPPRSHSR